MTSTPARKVTSSKIAEFTVRSLLVVLGDFALIVARGRHAFAAPRTVACHASACAAAKACHPWLTSRLNVQHAPLEHLDRQAGAGYFQALETLRPDARREEVSLGNAIIVQARLL